MIVVYRDPLNRYWLRSYSIVIDGDEVGRLAPGGALFLELGEGGRVVSAASGEVQASCSMPSAPPELIAIRLSGNARNVFKRPRTIFLDLKPDAAVALREIDFEWQGYRIPNMVVSYLGLLGFGLAFMLGSFVPIALRGARGAFMLIWLIPSLYVLNLTLRSLSLAIRGIRATRTFNAITGNRKNNEEPDADDLRAARWTLRTQRWIAAGILGSFVVVAFALDGFNGHSWLSWSLLLIMSLSIPRLMRKASKAKRGPGWWRSS